jgi:hypothetical protein
MTNYLGTTIVLLMSALTGCSSLNCGDSHPYANSVANPPLKAPPGLSVPAPDPNYAIHGLGTNKTKDAAKAAKSTCLVRPPQLVNAQTPSASNQDTPSEKAHPAPMSPTAKPEVTPDNKKPTLPASPTTITSRAVAGSVRVE